ncbi:MAG: c-type cytochrome [Flavobacteriaceae bacterium]|nr:c-type cytochrome [Flavobacteriaceae bacterium]
MRKIFLVLTVTSLFLISCGKSTKEEVKTEAETTVETKVETATEQKSDTEIASDQIALGLKLFNEKTCVSCHQVDAKVVGPSIKEIIKVYNEKNGNIVQFLKGNDPAIVDTDPGQVAIMKANLDGFVKDLSGDELQALAAYMRSVE